MSAVVAAPADVAAAPVTPLGSLVDVSLSYYKVAKEIVAANKTLGPRVSPLLAYGEEKTLVVLKKSPIKVEDVVAAVDSRVDASVKYTMQTVEALRAAPAQAVAKTQAKAEEVQQATAVRLDSLLDASAGYLAQYLPLNEEEKAELKGTEAESSKELKPVAIRAGKQGKVAAKKLQELALAKVQGLKKRTGDVVHVDLVKYSEFLDAQKENVKQTLFITLDKINEKVVEPTKEVAEKSRAVVNKRVIEPVNQRVQMVAIPIQDRVIKVWTMVGDEYNNRVVQPRDQIVSMFREELALQQELAKQKSGEDLTITAGLKAVIAAARARLSKEWEVRISPSLARVLRRNNGEFEEEEMEEKSFGDDEEDVSE